MTDLDPMLQLPPARERIQDIIDSLDATSTRYKEHASVLQREMREDRMRAAEAIRSRDEWQTILDMVTS